VRYALVMAILVAAFAAPGAGSAADAVVVGGAIPRIEPFTARAVACGERSCLDIAFRVRGGLGPRLVWRMTVLRPDGVAVYRGAGRTARGRRVAGRLWPSTPPRCGRYRVLLRVEDRRGDHLLGTRNAVRRTRCAPPGR
jgi:hypothetical protein